MATGSFCPLSRLFSRALFRGTGRVKCPPRVSDIRELSLPIVSPCLLHVVFVLPLLVLVLLPLSHRLVVLVYPCASNFRAAIDEGRNYHYSHFSGSPCYCLFRISVCAAILGTGLPTFIVFVGSVTSSTLIRLSFFGGIFSLVHPLNACALILFPWWWHGKQPVRQFLGFLVDFPAPSPSFDSLLYSTFHANQCI